MDAWPVTQAKDAFDWSGGLEDDLIDQLKRVCQDYMDKAEGYRERGKPITTPVMGSSIGGPSGKSSLMRGLELPFMKS